MGLSVAGSAELSILFLYHCVIGYQQCFLYNLSTLILTPARAEIFFHREKGIPGSLLKHNVLLRIGALSPLERFHFSFFSFPFLQEIDKSAGTICEENGVPHSRGHLSARP